ncbi:hypothetical protein KIN20_026876 [Parelaphostrongylus tenuis]|uniref:Uncharacterized protein n=1 Tax=Parelaphostrongylus tenuis TaxID=148309 RepID=A0AAD5WDJ6_PARTN|nr:hypothetical protein KIN20_026876 [Parelaphostrongylus tenuis]
MDLFGDFAHRPTHRAEERGRDGTTDRMKFLNKIYTHRDLRLRFKQKMSGERSIETISELYNHAINITYTTFQIGTK